MKLYKFLGINYAIEALRTQSLKVSNFQELNDPFELFALSLASNDERRFMNKVKARFAANLRLLCFSENYSSNLLWAHYAEKHSGVALEFEISENIVERICYVDGRINLPLFEKLEELIESKDPSLERQLSDLLYTKSDEWEYENEFRAIIDKDDVTIRNGIEFLELQKTEIKITGLVLGALNNTKIEDIKEALPANQTIEVIKVRPAFKSFQITRNLSFSPIKLKR